MKRFYCSSCYRMVRVRRLPKTVKPILHRNDQSWRLEGNCTPCNANRRERAAISNDSLRQVSRR